MFILYLLQILKNVPCEGLSPLRSCQSIFHVLITLQRGVHSQRLNMVMLLWVLRLGSQ